MNDKLLEVGIELNKELLDYLNLDADSLLSKLNGECEFTTTEIALIQYKYNIKNEDVGKLFFNKKDKEEIK